MAGYLTTAEFRAISLMPGDLVDRVNGDNPLPNTDFTQLQIDTISAWIDGKLRKRYDAPFAAPVPLIVQLWVTQIVTLNLWLKLGFQPNQGDGELYKQQAESAKADVSEASDAKEGRFDLPLRQDTTATGISKGGVISYSETSPFLGARLQRVRGRQEDQNGTGTRHGRG